MATGGSPFSWHAQPLYSIKAVLLLDTTGKRVLTKYYDKHTFPTLAKEQAFESALFEKTRRSSSEILIFENCLIVHRSLHDLVLFFVGNIEENEIMIMSALTTYLDSLHSLFRNQVDKRTTIENLDYALLSLDELIDGGILLENEPELIGSRVHLRTPDMEDQSVLTDALKLARDQIARTLLA
jgi:hypothetical protein